MPVGRTDWVVESIGEVYCERCLNRRWGKR